MVVLYSFHIGRHFTLLEVEFSTNTHASIYSKMIISLFQLCLNQE